MRKLLLFLLVASLKLNAYSQTIIPMSFSNLSPVGTPTRVMFNLPSDSNYVIISDQSANLLSKTNVCTGLKINVVGLNGATDFALDYVKKISPLVNSTVLGSFQNNGNNLFADLNGAGTIATINTTFKNTGSNSRIYKAIELVNGNRIVYLDKDPAHYNDPAVYSINNIVCGQMAELDPSNGGVLPRPDLIASIAVPPLVPPIPMITDMSYLPSGAIFISGSFTAIGPTISQKAGKLSANGTTVTGFTTLPGSNSNTANVYTNGLVTYLGITYVVYTNAQATSPTLVIFNEVANTFSLVSGLTFYINPQSSPVLKNGRIFVTGSMPASPGTTIGAYDPVTNLWYDYDNGLFSNSPVPNQTVTAIAWGKTCACAIIYGNFGQNATTLASNESYQAQTCVLGGPLAVGMALKLVKATDFEVTLHFSDLTLNQNTVLQRSTDAVRFSDLQNIPNLTDGNIIISQNNTNSNSYFRLRSSIKYSNIVQVTSKSKTRITVIGHTIFFPQLNTLEIYNSVGQRIAVHNGGTAILNERGIYILVSTPPTGDRVSEKVFIQ